MKQSAISDFLENLAPLRLAESWDPVGWLVGDPQAVVARVMTCLTVSPVTVDEAIAGRADLIVSHHPIPFRPVARLTTDDYTGHLLWKLARAGIGVYSLHTAWDSAAQGINQQLAEAAGCQDIEPLISRPDLLPGSGSGRVGFLPEPATVQTVWKRLESLIASNHGPVTKPRGPRLCVGDWQRPVERIGFGCGSGGGFLDAARRSGCQLLVTGEATFHTCVEASEGWDISMLLLGHYASERFGIESLSGLLQNAFPDLTVWASEREKDPIQLIPEFTDPQRDAK